MLNQLQFPGMPEPVPDLAEKYLPSWPTHDPDAQYDNERRWSADQLRESVQRGQPAIAINPAYLEDALEDGFLNQHASGWSNGQYAPGLRRREEHRLHGIPLDTPPEGRPVYGYPHHANDQTQQHVSVTGQYGEAVAVLHDDVKKRTTVTAGDSLGMDSWPTTWRRAESGDFDPLLVGSDFSSDYREAQIHGGVTAKDVARVEFYPEYYDEDPSEWAADEQAKKGLRERGIPYEVRQGTEMYKQGRMIGWDDKIAPPELRYGFGGWASDEVARERYHPASGVRRRQPYPVEKSPYPKAD